MMPRTVSRYAFSVSFCFLLLTTLGARLALAWLPAAIGLRQCVDGATVPTACLAARDDYVECLHHHKEFKRMKAVAAEMAAKGIEKVGETPPSSSESSGPQGGGGH
ncbi:hypothetical protein I4F81_010275 [Pyropia yezoensis]|uniref:Uncharacterized protein n=1 Tax=Pyropia yezoensis TaxID=2788 RepID=A0ACC3CCF1_PYRYE|nr:hypothetical protein I4F81_010275 [Neopyropia yezoensis]